MRITRVLIQRIQSACVRSALVFAAVSCGGGDGPTTTAAKLTSVLVSPATVTILAGQTVQLTATPRDQHTTTFTATVAWSTQSPAVASVNAAGLVTAIAPGSASIIADATADGITVSRVVPITVLAVPVLTSVPVTTSTATTVFLGSTTQLVAAPRDQRGDPFSATVTWSTLNGAVAAVSQSGVVTGNSVGTTTITATATAGATTVATNVPITVSSDAPALTNLVVTGPSGTVIVGETTQLAATSKDQYGQLFTAAIAWSSSNAGIALVSGSGLVTGVSPGAATITATGTVGAAFVTGSLPLTVNAPFPQSADVSATIGNTFSPGVVDIAKGGSVTWTFAATHNVVFGSATLGAPQSIGDTSSGSATRTFTTAGSFTYTCTLHSNMNGTVIVH